MDSGILSTQLEKLPASGLTLKLSPSSLLIWIYTFFFLLLLLALFLLPLTFWQLMLIACGLTAYCQLIFRKHLLLNYPDSVNKLVFTELDWCSIQLKSSRVVKANIMDNTVLTEFVVILNLRDTQRKSYSVMLTRQSVGADKFRHLKRYLRFKTTSKTEAQNQPGKIN